MLYNHFMMGYVLNSSPYINAYRIKFSCKKYSHTWFNR
jgi:hypothetical protein